MNVGPSSDHCVRYILTFSATLPLIIRHDEYQACGKEADKNVLRVF